MHLVLPAARSLRTLYALSSDKLWFAVAVVACLLAASEVAQWMTTETLPVYERGLAL